MKPLLLPLFLAISAHAEFPNIKKGIFLERFLRLDEMMRERKKLNAEDEALWLEGTGFLGGYLQNALAMNELKIELPYTLPNNASEAQITLVITKFVRTHPELLNQSSANLITTALRESFSNPKFKASKP